MDPGVKNVQYTHGAGSYRGGMTTTTTTLNGAVPILPYTQPRDAIRWLQRVFDATPTLLVPEADDEPLVHAEVRVGTGIVMVDDADRDSPFALPGPVTVYVVVDDPDGLHERAVAGGAEIVMGLTDQDYGSREFAAKDCYGNIWCFGTYRPAFSS